MLRAARGTNRRARRTLSNPQEKYGNQIMKHTLTTLLLSAALIVPAAAGAAEYKVRMKFNEETGAVYYEPKVAQRCQLPRRHSEKRGPFPGPDDGEEGRKLVAQIHQVGDVPLSLSSA
jgi:hypothetical protein